MESASGIWALCEQNSRMQNSRMEEAFAATAAVQ
jgi:hypothetical protein